MMEQFIVIRAGGYDYLAIKADDMVLSAYYVIKRLS